MMQYSLLDRRPEESVLPLLNEYNISVVARGPVAKGLLTNRAQEKLATNEAGYLTYTKKIWNSLYLLYRALIQT